MSIFSLLKVEKLVNEHKYNELNQYLQNNKEYSYSFINFLKFMRIEYDINNLDIIINNFLNESDIINKESVNRKDKYYKEEVKKLCNNRCVVTNKILNIEVAHIFEFKDCKYDSDKYSKFNGLYLKDSIHKLWDKYNYLIIDYCNETENIFFKININKINNETYKIDILKEILDECLISENELTNITDLKIPININKIYYKYYKNYINKRNNY